MKKVDWTKGVECVTGVAVPLCNGGNTPSHLQCVCCDGVVYYVVEETGVACSPALGPDWDVYSKQSPLEVVMEILSKYRFEETVPAITQRLSNAGVFKEAL